MGEEEKREERIFDAAIEITNRAECDAYLTEACGPDQQLRAKVEELLRHHEAGGILDKPPVANVDVTFDDMPLTEGPGTKIGRYKLLELIGEGGFGVVYMAEQREPIRRRVALKIIKLGMDTKQVIARFEAERQALAMMEHPNIAKVLDAGATETGRPYFVMELVKGIRITEYCDKNNLDTRQRLKLFIDVCKAVQHAHQKGIIHRDIKPSNVMITLHDGVPVPKIIDFGIAKATSQRLTEKTLFTRYAHMIGTPAYMSPEQAEMSGLDVDTRSDIYSLGVLLYELLTGATPFDAQTLLEAGYNEMQRIIREEEPDRPSTRLSSLGEGLTDVAKHRRTEPDSLTKLIRGDLDWIVLKTLEKDRTHRYETANGLLMDIERHLADEPVAAGPPSTVYRMKKFIRRNRTSVTAVTTVAAVVLVGLVVSIAMYLQAEQARQKEAAARDEAQAVADFLKNDVLASVDPAKAKGQEVAVRYILDAASKSMADKFAGKPLVEASICQTLGNTYLSLGKYEAAEPHLKRALAIRQEQLGADHPDTATSMFELGALYVEQGRLDETEPLYVKALQIRRRVLGAEHPDTLTSMHFLAGLYWDQSQFDKAKPLYIETLQSRRRVLGEEHPDTLESMASLAWLYWTMEERFEEAERLYVKALETQRRVLGQDHPETAVTMFGLGFMYSSKGSYDKAEPLLVNVLDLRRRVLGQEHPDTLRSMNALALIYNRQGRFDEAEELYKKVLEVRRRVLGQEHPDTLMSMSQLAWLYSSQERFDEAEELLVEALEITRRHLGAEQDETLGAMHNLAVFYAAQDRYGEAEALFKEGLQIARRQLGQEQYAVHFVYGMALVYHKQGRYAEAEPLYKEALDASRRTVGAEHPQTQAIMAKLVEVYEAWGKPEKAKELRRELSRKEDIEEAEK
jgi:serine/threonine protein kinase/tetratricopeptide (TPR) repeat protein